MNMKYGNIHIIGPKKFQDQTILALGFIKKKSKEDFNKVNKYLKEIKFSEISYMDVEKSVFYVGEKNVFNTLEWYASAIIHDTHHYYLHKIEEIPWKKGNMTKHETLCIKEQVRFFKKIKAPEDLIKYTKAAVKKKHWFSKKRNW